MCRLLGIAGTGALPIQETLTAFYPLCTDGCVKKGMPPGHTDGWGIAGFSNQRSVYFARQPGSAAQSEREYRAAAERAAKTQPPVLVAHFRKASGGPVDPANTHPFQYQDWVFAHNGTIF